MRIVCITLGSRGDVSPFIEVAKELKNRGHEITIATFAEYEMEILAAGIKFGKISGNSYEMVDVLLGNNDNSTEEGVNGIEYLLHKYSTLYEEFYTACKDKDVIMYMQFGALAYHFAEKFNVPVIRTFVFPFDPTKKYYSMKIRPPKNSILSYWCYYLCYFFMSYASMKVVNIWRKKLRLGKWNVFKSYRYINRKPILTLYQYDSLLAERDIKWGKHIYITGPWIKVSKSCNAVDKKLDNFLRYRKNILYVGFGSMVFDKMQEIYKKIIYVLIKNKINAILPKECESIVASKYKNVRLFYYTDYIEFDYLIGKVDAFLHHGGCGTVHWCLRNEMPQLIFPFGADQYFWGEQCSELGIGPDPINVKKEIDMVSLEERIIDVLKNGAYREKLKMISPLSVKDGTKRAADIIEKYFGK